MASKFCKNFCEGKCKDVNNCMNGYHKHCPRGIICMNPDCIFGHMIPFGDRMMINDVVTANEDIVYSDSEKCKFNLVCNNVNCNLRHDTDITNRILINKTILEFYKANPNYKDNTNAYPCKFYQTCNNAKCSFYHKIDFPTRLKVIKIVKDFKDSGGNKCKNNIICNNQYCNFDHDVDMDTREMIIDLINERKTKNGMIHVKNINETQLEDGFVYPKSSKKEVKKVIDEIELVDEIQKIKVSDYIKVCDQIKIIIKDDEIAPPSDVAAVSYRDIVTCSYTEYLEADVQNEIVEGTDWNDFM